MDVYSYIKQEEIRYQTMPVPVVEGYDFQMFDHVKTTTLYLNSKYKTGNSDDKPFRNIILPKVNLEHRAVEFDLDEIQFYINSDENYKSFLVKKFHERWALKNRLADFLDNLSETYTDYGGVLCEDTPDAVAVVPFQRLAFVDQTDMNSGPICQKHEFSPDQLMDMAARGWGNLANGATHSLEQVITLAENEKANTQNQNGAGGGLKAKTPGRYIEVYDLEGMLPETFLNPDGNPNKFVRQIQLVTFYTDSTGKKQGVTLYAGRKSKVRYKAYKRDEIFGRALGRGAVEELFEPQVWANDSEIKKTEMLTQVSKILNWTNDQGFKARNDTSEMENGDTLVIADGKTFARLDTTVPNLQAFENAVQSWDEQAQQIAAATDPIAGEPAKSNTPGELGILQNEEAHSLHEYRKGKLSTFVTEIYRDWVIPRVKQAVTSGDQFLAYLSTDEMGALVDQIVACEFNKTMIANVLSGEIVYPDHAQALQDSYRQQFFKSGNHKLITILKGELDDLPLEVEVNITGKQRNMQLMVQKLSTIWTNACNQLQVNPNFFTEHPEMAKLFNDIIEASGLSALTFGINGYIKPQQSSQPTPSTI